MEIDVDPASLQSCCSFCSCALATFWQTGQCRGPGRWLGLFFLAQQAQGIPDFQAASQETVPPTGRSAG